MNKDALSFKELRDINHKLEKENAELKAKLAHVERELKVTEFYADQSHWDDRIIILTTDEESTKQHDHCGGKRARQRIKERKEFK